MTIAINYKARPSLEVKKQSLTDKAYSAIKAEINAGHIAPGKFIDLTEIEDQLRISRTPVREAMLRLQLEKIVEIVPKRGIQILPMTATSLLEYFDVITGLELQAIVNICRRKLTRTDIMPVLYALSSFENALRGNDGEAWTLAEENFHRGLFILNGNKKLMEAGLSYRDIVQRAHFVVLGYLSTEDYKRCLRNYNELKAVLINNDEHMAREKLLAHWNWQRQVIADVLATRGIEEI